MANTPQTTEVVITITPDGDPNRELAAVLGKLADRIAAGWYPTLADLPKSLVDSEDNPVGTIEVRLPPAADPTTWLYHLDRLPTIGDNGTADLRLDNGLTRVWLSRGGTAGGHPFDRTVYVEVLDEDEGWRKWHEVGHFDAEAPGAPRPPVAVGPPTALLDAYELCVQAAAIERRRNRG